MQKAAESVSDKLNRCYKCLREKTDFVPTVAVVLGSGLGPFAEQVQKVCSVSYAAIEGFPVSTVSGHVGKFIFGTINGVKVVVMQGRVHYYEGYEMSDVVLPVRLCAMMGAKALVLTNSAGGISPALDVGDLMMLTGHISSFVPSPLRSKNVDELGIRFPDMSQVYDLSLQKVLLGCAETHKIPLKTGVYLQASGPNYETPEEIKMFGLLGADAVGMSTACEAMAAVHAGMKVSGISLITNKACGLSDAPLSHDEVKACAHRATSYFTLLLISAVEKMGEMLG